MGITITMAILFVIPLFQCHSIEGTCNYFRIVLYVIYLVTMEIKKENMQDLVW